MFLKQLGTLLVVGIILITGTWFGARYLGYQKYKPAVKEGSKVEYSLYTEYKTKYIYVPKITSKIDTVYITNPDTTKPDIPVVVATADTTLKDELGSQFKIKYYYPPANYFSVEANYKEKTIYQTTTITKPYEPNFWDRFNIVAYAGAGYDPFLKSYTMNIGIGVGINLKKIF